MLRSLCAFLRCCARETYSSLRQRIVHTDFPHNGSDIWMTFPAVSTARMSSTAVHASGFDPRSPSTVSLEPGATVLIGFHSPSRFTWISTLVEVAFTKKLLCRSSGWHAASIVAPAATSASRTSVAIAWPFHRCVALFKVPSLQPMRVMSSAAKSCTVPGRLALRSASSVAINFGVGAQTELGLVTRTVCWLGDHAVVKVIVWSFRRAPRRNFAAALDQLNDRVPGADL